MGVKIEPSFGMLKSGAIRGRLMINGEILSYTSKKTGVAPDGTNIYESKEVVKRKINKMYEELKHKEKVSGNWKVDEWLLYWMNNYKKPLDFNKSGNAVRRKGGKVNANSYMRLDCTYRNQLKGTVTGKRLLRKTLATVLPDDIQKLINELEEKNYSASTVKKAHNLLGEAFDVAVKNKYMVTNPCRLVQRSVSSGTDNKIREGGVLTKEHIESLFSEALREDDDGNPIYRYGAGVALQLAIGCRSGELRALKWKDIYDNVIHIRHSVSWVSDIDEKGNLLHTSHVYISDTKSDASVRSIPYEDGDIIDSCLQCLDKRCNSSMRKNDLVMPTSTGWYLTSNNYNKDVKRIVNAVCDNMMASHALRHSFISYLVNDENCDIASVASLAGHGDIRVTLRYASHTDIEKKKSTLKSVSGLYNNKNVSAS